MKKIIIILFLMFISSNAFAFDIPVVNITHNNQQSIIKNNKIKYVKSYIKKSEYKNKNISNDIIKKNNNLKIIYPKHNLPSYIAREKITVKGNMNISQLKFIISGEINQVIELSGTGKTKSFVNFHNTSLKIVLRYIKDVYGFNYTYNRGILKLANIETVVFKLPITPLTNTVTASLGSSNSQSSSQGSSGMTGTSGASSTSGISIGSSNSGQTGMIGGYASENVSNISLPFYQNLLKNVKAALSKKGKLLYSPRYQTLVVKDKVKNIEFITKYINQIKKKIGRAILVKLKVINVELSNGYNAGINFNNLYTDLGRYLSGSSLAINLNNTPVNSLTGSDSITINSGAGTQAVVSALDNFGKAHIVNGSKYELLSGTTKTLNSITTMPYLAGEQLTSVGALGSSTQSAPELGTATSGTNIVYTPIIYGNKVYISVQVILNTIAGYSTYTSGGATYTLPSITTQSASFTIKVPSGKTVLVAALQYKSSTKNTEGVPFLDKIPILGYLFSGVANNSQNNQLFIMITPIILGNK